LHLLEPVLKEKSELSNLVHDSIEQEANELMDDNSIEKSMSKADDFQVMLSRDDDSTAKKKDSVSNCTEAFTI